MNFTGCSEARLLGESFNEMFSKLEYYTKKLMQEQDARHAAELNSLQHQINPHFIYNTLASIRYLSMAGQREKVITGINSLTKLLRKRWGISEKPFLWSRNWIYCKIISKSSCCAMVMASVFT